MATTAYLFPDTNLFVQCRQLAELDWSQWADFDRIELVLTRPVQAELDRQKKAQGRISKRARMANAQLGRLLHETFIEIRASKPQVRLVSRLDLRRDESLASELDYAERDDQLVGIVAAFAAAHSLADVQVLSADIGVLGMAKHVGVKFWQIPDSWLLPPEADAEGKRRHAIKAELERYRRAEPRFEARSNSTANFQIARFLPLSQDDLESLMERIRHHFPIATDFGEATPKTEPLSLGAASRFTITTYTPASAEEIATYVEASYPQWIEECEDRLRRVHLGLAWQEGFPALDFAIENLGSRPAEDAIVTFEAMGAFSLSAPNDNEQGDMSRNLVLPKPPEPPRGKRREKPSLFGNLLDYESARALQVREMARMPPVQTTDPNAFYWYPARPNNPQAAINLQCRQWRHQVDPEVFTIVATFPRTPGTIKGAIRVNVHAANLTKPFSATFPVIFEIADADSLSEADALVEALIDLART